MSSAASVVPFYFWPYDSVCVRADLHIGSSLFLYLCVMCVPAWQHDSDGSGNLVACRCKTMQWQTMRQKAARNWQIKDVNEWKATRPQGRCLLIRWGPVLQELDASVGALNKGAQDNRRPHWMFLPHWPFSHQTWVYFKLITPHKSMSKQNGIFILIYGLWGIQQNISLPEEWKGGGAFRAGVQPLPKLYYAKNRAPFTPPGPPSNTQVHIFIV